LLPEGVVGVDHEVFGQTAAERTEAPGDERRQRDEPGRGVRDAPERLGVWIVVRVARVERAELGRRGQVDAPGVGELLLEPGFDARELSSQRLVGLRGGGGRAK